MTLYYNPEKSEELRIQEAYQRGLQAGYREGYKEAYDKIMGNLKQFDFDAVGPYPPDVKRKLILYVAEGRSLLGFFREYGHEVS